jgi:hypothetical protein
MSGETPQSEAVDRAEKNELRPHKKLTPAAERALAEAEQRRRLAADPERPKELRGRDGLDPARYGDWEVKGIASDF